MYMYVEKRQRGRIEKWAAVGWNTWQKRSRQSAPRVCASWMVKLIIGVGWNVICIVPINNIVARVVSTIVWDETRDERISSTQTTEHSHAYLRQFVRR